MTPAATDTLRLSDRAEHRNRDQTVAVLPDQSPQPGAFGAEDERRSGASGRRRCTVPALLPPARRSTPQRSSAPRALAQCSRRLRFARAQAPPPMLSRRRRRARRNGAPGEPPRERLPHPPCGGWPRRCAGLRSRRARRGERRRTGARDQILDRVVARRRDAPPRCPDALRRARSRDNVSASTRSTGDVQLSRQRNRLIDPTVAACSTRRRSHAAPAQGLRARG